MEYEQLKLENQICFPVYAASRLITRAYQPFLEKIGLTYPQYLVLMVLWENNRLSVNAIAAKLVLNTNTITPLLKRMEERGLLNRIRSKEDERQVNVELTETGRNLRHKAAKIPELLLEGFSESGMSTEEILAMKSTLMNIIRLLK